MKALVKNQAKPGLWLENIVKPEINDNEVLIKVIKNGICGTDLHIYDWDEWAQKTIPVPLTIGHEFYGKIVEVGNSVTDLTVGARVSGEAHLTCGQCRHCRGGKKHLCPNTQGLGVNVNGAYAEFVKLPAENVYPLPDYISDEVAAILDPLGNAVHTVLSFDLVGEDVLITGAGPIGIMATQIAKSVGARNIVVTDVNDFRLSLAKQMGATRTVNVATSDIPTAIRKLDMIAFDVGLELSGNESALCQLIESMYPGGRVAILGIPKVGATINWHDVIFKELTLKGIYGREMFETWYKMISLLKNDLDITPIITHRFKINDYEEAFKAAKSDTAGKVILEWD